MAEEKDPNKTAVALTYDKVKDPAPRISAKGHGLIADQIIKVAGEHNIPVRQDAALVEILEKLDIDSIIPLEAYRAVAEILNYVYKVNSKGRNKGNPT